MSNDMNDKLDFILLITWLVISFLSGWNIPDLAPYIIVGTLILFLYISFKANDKNT